MNTLDADSLIAAGREIEVPFRMLANRPGSGEVEISFLKVFRNLPSRRIVGLAEVNGERLLVKIFLGRTAGKYAFRERAGVLALARSGVNTPALLWEGDIRNGRLLAFHYLEDAISLAEEWRRSHSLEKRAQILGTVMVVMARMHHHGVMQNDLHLANFLHGKNEISTIDGGAVTHHADKPLDENVSIRNLALFFAQFYPRYDELVEPVMKEYERERGWQAEPHRIHRLHELVAHFREVRKGTYIRKSFRDCTRYACHAGFRRYRVCQRDAYTGVLKDLVDDPDVFMDSGKILKRGNSSTVVMVDVAGRKLVIKRYNIKGFWHGVRRAFRKSRAWQSWANIHRLEYLGMPSLQPLAMLENRFGPLVLEAWLVTEYIEGPDALDCLHRLGSPNGQEEALAAYLRDLADRKICHGDLKASNFVMSEEGPVLIDLDSMVEYRDRETFRPAFRRDLLRFMENWRDYPDIGSRFAGLLTALSSEYGVTLEVPGRMKVRMDSGAASCR